MVVTLNLSGGKGVGNDLVDVKIVSSAGVHDNEIFLRRFSRFSEIFQDRGVV